MFRGQGDCVIEEALKALQISVRMILEVKPLLGKCQFGHVGGSFFSIMAKMEINAVRKGSPVGLTLSGLARLITCGIDVVDLERYQQL